MGNVFSATDILLPRADLDMGLWAALACDQFTSQPDYWQRAEALTKDAPSTLHITLPEVYLGSEQEAARLATFGNTMRDYLQEVLTRNIHGFIYIERHTESGVRPGLVGAVDLEAYSYEKDAAPQIRPSENTIVARIPPRLVLRRGALLETPHIMMLLDDEECRVIEPFATKKDHLEKLYDTELMLGGGHITGYAVSGSADIAAVEAAVCALGTQEFFDEKYPQAKGAAPLSIAVGDGNHSLATAKAHWEEIKKTLTPAQQENHPARHCLVELVNVHCPALGIEPIHRAVFGTDFETFSRAFAAFLTAQGATLLANGIQQFTLFGQTSDVLIIGANDAPAPLAVGTLDAFLSEFCAAHTEVSVDYIHGEDAVKALAQAGAVGVILPDFAKSDLFRGVVLGGVLPKKTFSMGHATEKRYYLECRKITL